MYVITYSLRENQTNSNFYYNEAAIFTNEVLSQAKDLIYPLIEEYQSFINSTGVEKLRTMEEYVLEFLTLGVLWKVYSGDALGLEKIPQQLLTHLVRFRKKGGTLKPGIDFLRGVLGTLFLSPDLYDHMFTLSPTLEHAESLLDWLDATGDFNQEVKRLRIWQGFLATQTPREITNILATAITFAAWFEARSEEALGRYTPHVDRFLNEFRPQHYWQEDVIFCGRRRVEYHLNMVGAEIMNSAFRDAFLKTSKKAVFLPACMRLLPEGRCQAKKTDKGLFCSGCIQECMVHQLVRLGKTHNFSVIIIPHESTLYSKGATDSVISKDTGIIGISCVLNLISGGWMLKERDIPAQCVLLDYCGCKNHWHHEGIPTEINISVLKKILEI